MIQFMYHHYPYLAQLRYLYLSERKNQKLCLIEIDWQMCYPRPRLVQVDLVPLSQSN